MVKFLFTSHDRPQKIDKIDFGLMSSKNIVNFSEFHVTERILYTMPSRSPAIGGVLDQR